MKQANSRIIIKMQDYRKVMAQGAPRQLGNLERSLRRHMIAAMDKFEALSSGPVPATAHGLRRLETERECAQVAIEQYREMIQSMNRSEVAK